MRTKVAPRETETTEFRRRTAAVMRFLVESQRQTRGHTLQALAKAHGTQRSNLSAYIRSDGDRRNIKYERLRDILFRLGAHWDFTLRPLLHRWDVAFEETLEGMRWLAESNRVAKCQAFRVHDHSASSVAFLVIETKGGAACLIRVRQSFFGRACRLFGVRAPVKVADELACDAVQSAWLSEDRECRQRMGELLGGSAAKTIDAAPESRDSVAKRDSATVH